MSSPAVVTHPGPKIKLEDSVQYLKGVGPEKAKALSSVGIKTIEDLLYYIPRRYLDRSTILPINKLKVGSNATVIGRVEAFGIKKGRKPQFQVILKDQSGFLRLIWFSKIRYVKNLFEENDLVVASGEITHFYGLQMVHPEFEIVSKSNREGFDEELIHTGRIIPLYPSTAELKKFHLDSRGLRRILKPLLDNLSNLAYETLPQRVISDSNLLSLLKALKNVHFPENLQMTNLSRSRLAFDELFYLELMLALRKKRIHKKEEGIAFLKPGNLVRSALKMFPFELTQAQKKVLREIARDMMSGDSMHRLLQGDVGSGKTIVALVAMLMAVESGYQAALMAPTEILAEQHHITVHRMLESLGVKTVLLTSSVLGTERETILEDIAKGRAKVILGTHALIQKKVDFFKLGLVVIDEQHRFGVMQRAKLKQKGISPDVLVMTATPIPRSLALTLYGDLDVSVIDSLPPGRKKVKTSLHGEKSKSEIYEFLEKELQKGHQAYIVYPLVEESEKADLKAATQSYEFLKREIFPHRRLALLHGRIKSKERESIMQAFRDGDYDILVATTVVEVGVDVPNATIMVIEHAER
ncbi:MAG: ATP-dependent DNA helicase RecG, partial [Candidatus Zixiibacteriota bacterium]